MTYFIALNMSSTSGNLECRVCNRTFTKPCALSAHVKSKYHLNRVALISRMGSGASEEANVSSDNGTNAPVGVLRGVKRPRSDMVSDPAVPVECMACGKSFANMNYLRHHENTLEHAKKIMEGDRYGEEFDSEFVVFKGTSALKNRYASFVLREKVESVQPKEIADVLDSMLPVLRKLCISQLEEKNSLKIQLKCIISIRRWYNIGAGESAQNGSDNELRRELSEPFAITLRSKQYAIFRSSSLPLDEVIGTRMFSDIKTNYHNVTLSGSEWVYDGFKWGELLISKYNVVKSGSYIPLPTELENVHGIINVKNISDEKCFMYSLLSRFVFHRARRVEVETYQRAHILEFIKNRYQIEFDFNCVQFPTPVEDIAKFERYNPQISINVFGLTKKNKLYPLKNVGVEKEFHFDLLYLVEHKSNDEDEYYEEEEEMYSDEEAEAGVSIIQPSLHRKSHYCLITDLNKLLRRQFTTNHDRVEFCKKCFAYFRGENCSEKVNEHKLYCNTSEVQPAHYSFAGKEERFQYIRRGHEQSLHFVVYADFETMLKPVSEEQVIGQTGDGLLFREKSVNTDEVKIRRSNMEVITHHEPTCFSLVTTFPPGESRNKYLRGVDEDDKHLFDIQSYVGVNCVQVFVDYIINLAKVVKLALNHFPTLPYIPMAEKETWYQECTSCVICKKAFERLDDKCFHHCHTTGTIFGVAHIECNLKFKRQRFLPIVFHNGSKYDFHLLMQAAFGEREINVIPHTEEIYISFSIKLEKYFSIRFIDSYRFLTASLRSLSMLLNKDEFHYTDEFFSDPEKNELVKQKGIYPYKYIKNFGVLNETSLPAKEEFNDNDNNVNITDEEYAFALKVWRVFSCRDLKDYTSLYCEIDTLILADVSQQFRKLCYKVYDLEPFYYVSLPGFAFDAMKKYTRCRLDLFDVDNANLYCFFENAVRGGITNTISRYRKINTVEIPEYYEPLVPPSVLKYIDCNGLYSKAMMLFLPTGQFIELDETEFDMFTSDYILQLDDEGEYGYWFQVDIEYPSEIHDIHNCLPFFPEKKKVNNVTQLVCTLENKVMYSTHYTMLKLALKHGLKLTKIHKVIKFKQAPVLKDYIELNNNKRATCSSSFEKNFYKLCNNAIFGKTLENFRNRINFDLVNNVQKFEKLVAQPNFKEVVYFNENLLGVHRYKSKMSLKNPNYLGATILDLSKVIMYEFYYESLKYIFNYIPYELCYMDTDSFILAIGDHSADPYFKEHFDYFDFSDYPKNHPLYSAYNKKVPGKFKDELNGKCMTEFISLTPKVYAYKVHGEKEECKKVKGVLKSIVARELTFNSYYNCLINDETVLKNQFIFNVKGHRIRTICQRKLALGINKNCEKRVYINHKDSLAFGHYKLRNDDDVDDVFD